MQVNTRAVKIAMTAKHFGSRGVTQHGGGSGNTIRGGRGKTESRNGPDRPGRARFNKARVPSLGGVGPGGKRPNEADRVQSKVLEVKG